MLNIEEVLASVGISAGAYGIYKIAVKLYQRYYINSECNRPNEHSTDIVVHISDVEPPKEALKDAQPEAEMARK